MDLAEMPPSDRDKGWLRTVPDDVVHKLANLRLLLIGSNKINRFRFDELLSEIILVDPAFPVRSAKVVESVVFDEFLKSKDIPCRPSLCFLDQRKTLFA